MHRKCGLRFEKSQLSFSIRRRRLTFRAHWGLAVGAARGLRQMENQHRKIVYLPLYVEKPFNSKVIKSFVPELRSHKCFFVFRDSYVIYIWVMNILCTFHVFMYGYVTCVETIVIVVSKQTGCDSFKIWSPTNYWLKNHMYSLLTVCQKMSSSMFKNVIYKLCIYKS